LLLNRLQFLREQANASHYQSVNITRAILCELVASRILRRYSEDNPGSQGLLLLANILVAGFDPFQNAPEDVLKDNEMAPRWAMQKKDGYLRKLPALEVAIVSESKLFLSCSACQKVVKAIFEGRVVYTPSSFIDILPDHYKHKPISLYNPMKAPLLNQYRLIVPRTRNIIEVCQFVVLLTLYILVMWDRDPTNFSLVELAFCIYTFGWALDQFASILEHGWVVFTQNLWSFLDVAFVIIYAIYIVLRIHGLRAGCSESSQQAMDVLSMGAPVLIPRLAFNFMSENMLFISLRAMMADFTVLTLLAAWCFGGFLLSMTWLGDSVHEPTTISIWMLWVWFGLDGTGIQRSIDLHWLLGPILMITFAFLGNTLFLTILVSMLSNTFANIVSNANAEIQYRRSVLTLEGVKCDAIFAYLPPFNILALCTLLPLKFFVSPRWFHKINVAAVRTLNAPLLLIISYLERQALWSSAKRQPWTPPRSKSARLGFWELSRGFSVHGDIQAVFDSAPPQPSEDDEIIAEDNAQDVTAQGDFAISDSSQELQRPTLSRSSTQLSKRSRRDSMAPFGMLKNQLQSMLNEGPETVEVDTATKLENMEASIRRIEELLAKVCQNLEKEKANEIVPLDDNDQTLEAEMHE
jgi:uncharacterized metal-binding protein